MDEMSNVIPRSCFDTTFRAQALPVFLFMSEMSASFYLPFDVWLCVVAWFLESECLFIKDSFLLLIIISEDSAGKPVA